MKFGNGWASREHFVVECPIHFIHSYGGHRLHILNHILVKHSHFLILFIILCFIIFSLGSLGCFERFLAGALIWILRQIDVGDHLFICVCRVNVGLVQMRVNSFASSKLSQIQAETLLNCSTKVESVENLSFVVATLHVA